MQEILNAQQLETVIGDNPDKVIVLDFYADWCGPCKMLANVLEEVITPLDDVVLVKANVEQATELAQQFGVMSVPRVVLFKDGQADGSFIGYKSKPDVLAYLKEFRQ